MDKYRRLLYMAAAAANESVTSRAISRITITSKRIVTSTFKWYHFFRYSMHYTLSQRKFCELDGPLNAACLRIAKTIGILINGLRSEREIMTPTLMREIQTVGGNHGGNNLILKLFHDIINYSHHQR